jgi:hypothetical protein
MTTLRSLVARIAAIADGFMSAGAVAAAIESGRRPNDIDLATLGIDPRDFARIRPS